MANVSVELRNLNRKVEDLTSSLTRLSMNFQDYIKERSDGKEGSQRNEEEREDFSEDDNIRRGNWSRKLEYLLASIGCCVGLGNMWSFPILCYKHGGAAFLVAYAVMMVLIGMPMFLLEASLGQFTSSGVLTLFQVAPMFKGLGGAMLLVAGILASYYAVVLGWSFFYLFASFTSDLPWRSCGNDWNSVWCSSRMTNTTLSECQSDGLFAHDDGVCYNGTVPVAIYDPTLANASGIGKVLPSEEYLWYYVWSANKEGGLDDLGDIRWQMVCCLLFAWFIIACSLSKGIKSLGKVIYFTALFPYLALIILFVRGIFLEHAQDGIDIFIKNTKWEKLHDVTIWTDAASQVFLSSAAATGSLHVLASYNLFHNDIVFDSILISIISSLTSVFSGFVMFIYLGYLARQQGVSIDNLATGGPGLVFIVIPAAIADLQLAPPMSIIFFMMLITVGLNSVYALVQAMTTSLQDQFPSLRIKQSRLTFSVCFVLFLMGLSMTTEGGTFMLSLLDNYTARWNLLLIALIECILLMYVYGSRRYKQDIGVMVGHSVWKMCATWWTICWGLLTPMGILLTMLSSWVYYRPLTEQGYEYPVWAQVLGWLITGLVLLCVVSAALVAICRTEGSFASRVQVITSPTKLWGPALVKHRKLVHHHKHFIVDPYQIQHSQTHKVTRQRDSGYAFR